MHFVSKYAFFQTIDLIQEGNYNRQLREELKKFKYLYSFIQIGQTPHSTKFALKYRIFMT